MNPLTQIKNTQKATKREIASGIGESASWHARFKHSAYVFAGGLSYDLTEGDLLAVFAQYGEVVDVNLVRSKETGKSRGFAFLAYVDQRSTNLAVDNLSGAKVAGRIIKVDHVDNYKRKKAEVTGEPESEEDEPANNADVEKWKHDMHDEEGPTVVDDREARPTGGGDINPWQKAGSIHALMAEAEAALAKRKAALQAAGAQPREDHGLHKDERNRNEDDAERRRKEKHKKEKKDKDKDKDKKQKKEKQEHEEKHKGSKEHKKHKS